MQFVIEHANMKSDNVVFTGRVKLLPMNIGKTPNGFWLRIDRWTYAQMDYIGNLSGRHTFSIDQWCYFEHYRDAMAFYLKFSGTG